MNLVLNYRRAGMFIAPGIFKPDWKWFWKITRTKCEPG